MPRARQQLGANPPPQPLDVYHGDHEYTRAAGSRVRVRRRAVTRRVRARLRAAGSRVRVRRRAVTRRVRARLRAAGSRVRVRRRAVTRRGKRPKRISVASLEADRSVASIESL